MFLHFRTVFALKEKLSLPCTSMEKFLVTNPRNVSLFDAMWYKKVNPLLNGNDFLTGEF